MLGQRIPGGASLTIPMSYDDYRALGETLHTAYYDGLTHVNPSTRCHIQIARRLTRALEDALPAAYEVLPEAGWATEPEAVFIPDIVVVRRDSPGADVLLESPLLVVEVVSPSTRRDDFGRKREVYAQFGAGWYWIVEPDRREIVVFENLGDAFVEQERWAETTAQVRQPVALHLDLGTIFG